MLTYSTRKFPKMVVETFVHFSLSTFVPTDSYSMPFVRHRLSRSLGHRGSCDRQLSFPTSNVISVRSIGKLRQTVELEVGPGHYVILCV